MKITFCGAARQVTGSAHLIELDDGFKILLDCGLYQGRESEMKDFNEKWLFSPSQIDCLILSHAHIDHSGRIPKLVADGFEGNIFCTHATRSLCAIMLLDSAKIQEKDAEYYNKRQLKKPEGKRRALQDPLYTSEDAKEAMNLFVAVGYDRWFNVHEKVKVQFRDAGHILGSASVTLQIREGDRTISFGFTGDVGRPNRPILRDPKIMPEVDYLICESTYGDKDHEEPPAETDHFLRVIQHTCVEKKGKLLIPAFSVGRTQEIVYMLDRLSAVGKLPRIPVYVDSPLAVNATTIFGSHPECYDSELNQYLLIDDDPFGFNRLTYVRDVEVSKQLNESKEPCIIISSSGMMNAGRVKHHLFHAIDQQRNTILIVGYCSPETPGGQLRNGAKTLKLFGETKLVNAEIEVMDSFSAHADRRELLAFLQPLRSRMKKIFLVHGEIERQEAFKTLLEANDFREVVIPSLRESFQLD